MVVEVCLYSRESGSPPFRDVREKHVTWEERMVQLEFLLQSLCMDNPGVLDCSDKVLNSLGGFLFAFILCTQRASACWTSRE